MEQQGNTFADRLKLEASELRDKFDKLSAFLGTEKFNSLPMTDRVLLSKQHTAMHNYLSILGSRIARL